VTLTRLWILSGVVAGALLAQPSLRITSPADGTVVHPGQPLKVRVEASGTFLQVIVIGGGRIGFSKPLLAPPYEFTMQIPDRISPGPYPLTADGATAPGQSTSSETITLMVEPADAPISLTIRPSLLRLSAGDKGYLRVFGVFPDGKTIDLTPSTQASFTSDAPRIAEVDATRGIVSALAVGSAKIKATYRGASVEVPVTVAAAKNR